MDAVRENEAIYGGSDHTDRTADKINEYRCNACGMTFTLADTGCTHCGADDWEFSPGGVGFS